MKLMRTRAREQVNSTRLDQQSDAYWVAGGAPVTVAARGPAAFYVLGGKHTPFE